jgi:hypothetical protein
MAETTELTDRRPRGSIFAGMEYILKELGSAENR